MKKKILAMLILCSTVSVFSACGPISRKNKDNDKEIASEEEDKEDKEDKEEEDKEDEEDENEEDEEEDKKSSSSKGDGSSVKKPLSIDKEGKVEMKVYGGEDDEKHVFITMNIDEVYRGKSAEKYVDKFNNRENSSLRIDDVEEGCEYFVVEYSVEAPKLGEDETIYGDLDLDIKGVDGETLTVNNTRYYLSAVNMQEEDTLKSKGKLDKMYLISQIPKDADEFLMFFNALSGEGSYYLYEE